MPEPTSTTASVVTLTTMAAATPVLHVAGVSLGLRPDVLLAGFAGAVAAMALLNQYGKKKEDGELDIDDQGNVQLVDAQAFAKGMNDLHTEDLPDLKLHQVALENFPADIDLSVMEALLPMVLETEPVGA